MATKRKHTAELAKLAADVPDLIDTLEGEVAQVVANMAALKKAGLIYATEHWRKEKPANAPKDAEGEPKYLYLLYPQQPGEPRRRDYVGCDAGRIEEARAGIVRAEQYDRLAAEHSALECRMRRIADALREARHYLAGK